MHQVTEALVATEAVAYPALHAGSVRSQDFSNHFNRMMPPELPLLVQVAPLVHLPARCQNGTLVDTKNWKVSEIMEQGKTECPLRILNLIISTNSAGHRGRNKSCK